MQKYSSSTNFSFSFASVEDVQFHDIVHCDDYFDTEARAPIQKRDQQRRPSNLQVLGPSHSGYLYKKASNSNIFRRHDYQLRYFTLDSQYLKYWNTAGKAVVPNRPRASIDLRSIQVDSIQMIEACTFQLVVLDLTLDATRKTTTTRPPYVLKAKTVEEAHRWLKEIQYRVRNIRLTRVMSTVWSDLHKEKSTPLSKYSSAPSMCLKKTNYVRTKPLMSSVVETVTTPRHLRWDGAKQRRQSF